MVINYLGDNCFRITSGSLSLLTDSNSNRLKSDITLKTFTKIPAEPTEEIIGAGEYELQDVRIDGFEIKTETNKDSVKTAFLAEIEEMRLCFLGHISSTLEADVIEKLGKIDILFLPVGNDFLTEESAKKIILQLKPRIVIPSLPDGDNKLAEKLANDLGQEFSPQEKLTIKAKELGEEGLKLVILTKS